MRDLAWFGLHEFASYDNNITEFRLLKILQNIAAALAQLKNYELALGYANAAVQIQPFTKPAKAIFRAAQCCIELGKPLAAFHYAMPLLVRDADCSAVHCTCCTLRSEHRV